MSKFTGERPSSDKFRETINIIPLANFFGLTCCYFWVLLPSLSWSFASNVTWQKRGRRCEYSEKVTKRGPKPGTTRDAAKLKLKHDEIAKIVEELERHRQLSDYWRNKYIDVHSFAATVVKDPQMRLLVESSVGSDSTPLLAGQEGLHHQTRNPIIFDAVNSFLVHLNPAMPNVFVYDAEKIYEWFVYIITPPQLSEPFDSFVPDKMAEGALMSTVFAHGTTFPLFQFPHKAVAKLVNGVIIPKRKISSSTLLSMIIIPITRWMIVLINREGDESNLDFSSHVALKRSTFHLSLRCTLPLPPAVKQFFLQFGYY